MKKQPKESATVGVGMRIKPSTNAMWEKIAERRGISKVAVFEMLIHQEAEAMQIRDDEFAQLVIERFKQTEEWKDIVRSYEERGVHTMMILSKDTVAKLTAEPEENEEK